MNTLLPQHKHATSLTNKLSSTKRLKFMVLQDPPVVDQDYIQSHLFLLESAFLSILNNNYTVSYEELYKACENLCLLKQQQPILDLLLRTYKAHLTDCVLILSNDLLAQMNDPLALVLNLWNNTTKQINIIKSILLYLDRTYILHSPQKSIFYTLTIMFRDIVFSNMAIKDSLMKAILAYINAERDGKPISSELLTDLVHMFKVMESYHSLFEPKFLDSTKSYYTKKSAQLLNVGVINQNNNMTSSADNVAAYLDWATKCLQTESTKCEGAGFLEHSTNKNLIQTLESVLIHNHVQLIIDQAFVQLAQNNKFEELSWMYKLFERTKDLDPLKLQFVQYIKTTGTPLVNDPEKDSTMIENLLSFQYKLNQICQLSFNSNQLFIQSFKESFASFVNERKMKPAELIAIYIDKLLKTGVGKGSSEDEVEDKLNQCVSLFRFVQGKDVFEAFYGKTLAKRLLLGKSASVDSEKSMLVKLKSECGADFTSKLEGMFKDMALSKEIMASFQQSPKYTDQLGSAEFNVNILTSGYWPTYPIVDVILPETFCNYQRIFTDFYTKKYSGRRISWPVSLGHCNIQYHTQFGTKDLVVSLYQSLVLLLFNNCDTLTTKDISLQTGIETSELERTLQSISLAKVKILKKNPHTKNVTPTDQWTINLDFQHPNRRIVINTIQAQETKQEIDKTNESVFVDRQWVIDAAIVRIMKSKKKLPLKELICDLYEVLKFPLETGDLKKRIESLIERDYIERDANDASVYIYLA
ncbi:cul4a protein [Globomyces pollinis-pini]|nr:cul4a protein [Globomyces pollinis-pini]